MDTLLRSISYYMERLDFPADAQETFLSALQTILSKPAAADRFSDLLSQYERSEHCPYKQMLADAVALAEPLGIHAYTVSVLLFLCLAEKLRRRYAERGLDEAIFFASLRDLRYKLEECRLVYGINGSFVAPWFSGFFDLSRFALGRLQFEIIRTREDYRFGCMDFPAGSPVINVHIPRTGTRMPYADVLEAYRLAAEMFASDFTGRPMVFTCHSWLLDPWNLTVLSPSSNLAAFIRDYRILQTGQFEGYGELWRLFDCLCTDDTTNLPKDSSLRRAYAERIDRAEPIFWGQGFFLYLDGKILTS